MDLRTQIMKSLAAVREHAKLQAHLFSMDARELWKDLEDELFAVEDQLARNGEKAVSAAAQRATELVQRAESFLDRHALGELSLLSPASRVMTAAVVSCLPSDSLNAAAQIMWDEDCGAVPVVDAAGFLVGLITDRDLSMACYTQGRAPAQARVDSAMSRAVYSVGPSAPLSDVIALMKKYRVRRVPVVSEGGRLQGLISLADLLRHLPEQRQSSPFEAALIDAMIAISAKQRPGRTLRSVLAAE
jgi:CBS domain-containing protein